MTPTQETAQKHSVVGYMQRLSTKELFYLLRCYLDSKPDSVFYAEQIISILENRFDETQKYQQPTR